uniref:Pentacotripeptide-repeat region of PRORP domain-containing protein n=2 Tax=Nymphaea colorata TaxID=210225 RepID=A0A5K1F6Z3_9MAGN|nr:unnamed protein product [Nymphaea colorata]
MWRLSARDLLRRASIRRKWAAEVITIRPTLISTSFPSLDPLRDATQSNPFVPSHRFLSLESQRIESVASGDASSPVGGDHRGPSCHSEESRFTDTAVSNSVNIDDEEEGRNDGGGRKSSLLFDEGARERLPEENPTTETLGNKIEDNPSEGVTDNTFEEPIERPLDDGAENQIEGTLESPLEVSEEQVQSVLSILQSTSDGSIESSLDGIDVDLSEEFVLRVLGEPHIMTQSLVAFFKWASTKTELTEKATAIELLVCALGVNLRKNDAYSLWDFIKESMEKDKSSVSTKALKELISVFRRLGKARAALEVFNKFDDYGYDRDPDTYYFTIDALCCRKMYDDAWLLCEEMLNLGKLPGGQKIGELIVYFCRGGRAKDAHLIYLVAKEKNIQLQKSVVSFLVSSLCRDDKTVHLGEEILNDFVGDARKYAIKPFSSVSRGLCRIKDLDSAKSLLLKMVDMGPPPGNPVFNSVINGLSRTGKLEEAIAMMRLMETRGLRPDVYTYTVILGGFAKNGQMDEACKYFSEAKQRHSKLTPVTYHAMIRGYVKLENYDKAVELLNEMKEYGVSPTTDEYTKLIQSLCKKALDWKTAEKLLEDMKKNGQHLDGLTSSLVAAVKELFEEEVNFGSESIEVPS